MTVFLMTIRETLPPTEKTPLISLYYGVSICLVSFASGLAVVTLNLHHRGVRGTRVPPFVKSFVLDKLAKIVFLNFNEEIPETIKRKNCPLHCKSESSSHQHQQHQQSHSQQQHQPPHISPKYVGRRHTSDHTPPNLDLSKDVAIESHQWSKVIGRVQATIEKNERRLLDQDNRERTELEWKQVALVSDRALLCIFFLTTAVSTAVILCGSPPTDGKAAIST